MKRSALRALKEEGKSLPGRDVVFERGHKLPKPLDKVVRSTRTTTTKLIRVSDQHSVCFLFRNADVRVRTGFYAWLLQKDDKSYTAIAALHYHGSHKPPHIHLPCDEENDTELGTLYTCKQLTLKGGKRPIDPRTEDGRLQLIGLFCRATGIKITKDDSDDATANQELDLRPL